MGKPCDICKGKGYILSTSVGHPKGDKLRVERCDECMKFDTDKQARFVYKQAKSQKEHFEKWFKNFLRSNDAIKINGVYRIMIGGVENLFSKSTLKKYYKEEYYLPAFG
jgi:hypothetical protein